VSKTNSPEADDTFTDGALLVPEALAKVPNGTLWSTPVKVITPTTAPSVGAVENVTTTLAVPVAGATNWYIHVLNLVPFVAVPTRDKEAVPPYVTLDTFRVPLGIDALMPTSIKRFVPDPVVWDLVTGELAAVVLDVASIAMAASETDANSPMSRLRAARTPARRPAQRSPKQLPFCAAKCVNF
jgi:hypothetical protein